MSDGPSGPGSSFLVSQSHRYGGRRLQTTTLGPHLRPALGTDPAPRRMGRACGAQFIQNFADQGSNYFALPVVPSSSRAPPRPSRASTLPNAQIPVIGTVGMLKEQYQDPFVWPVVRDGVHHADHDRATRQRRPPGSAWCTTTTTSSARRGRRRSRTTSRSCPARRSMPRRHPARPAELPDVERFNNECGPTKRCEFVAMLLEPGTAISWINSMGDDDNGRRLGFGSKGTGGAQPLFNAKFARDAASRATACCCGRATTRPSARSRTCPAWRSTSTTCGPSTPAPTSTTSSSKARTSA